jgi:drug/metabolite transporter (DMT)-like permease
MPLGALLLVLGAALCHGAWNLILKNEPRRREVSLGALGVGVLLCSPVLLVYRVTDLSPAAWAVVLVSGVFETAYVLTLTAAYEAGDLSLVYPVARGTAPVCVAPLAVLLLDERLSAQGVAGIALVVLGIYGSHAGSLRSWSVSDRNRRALALAALTGLMTAGYSLVNKVGVRMVPVPLYAFLVFGVDAALMYAVISRGRRARWPFSREARWSVMAAVGSLMMGAYVAVLFAMSLAPVSYVVAAREISIVMGAGFGVFVLGERHSIPRIAGALVIFAGLVVIALSR